MSFHEPHTPVQPHDQPALRHLFVCGLSRSGTTLLATILDSHPDVSMGYELLPAGLPRADEAVALIREAVAQGGDGKGAAKLLREWGHGSLGQFARRCERTLVPPSELAEILADFEQQGIYDLDEMPLRARLSSEVVERKRAKEGTKISGFKVNTPDVEVVARQFTDAGYLFITRDPRDVVASQLERGFDRTVKQISKAWEGYLAKFEKFAAGHDRAAVVRYEDLVRRPRPTLEALCAAVGLDFVTDIERFFESKASIHDGGHANAENLRQNFFTTSVDRWARNLPVEHIREIQSLCAKPMAEHGYRLAATAPPEPAPSGLFRSKHKTFAPKRKYYMADYANLALAAAEGRTVLTWREATAGVGSPNQILLIRHDIDHDIENAVQIARWESEHDLRATYCVLHTAWYYGDRSKRKPVRYQEMVNACLEIQELGHEINFHNAVPIVALKEGIDACDLLAEELGFLRMHGLDIRGTSSHGDPLNRELNFVNHEIFSEAIHESRGGRRTVTHNGNSVELGTVSMSDFGLDYEGYDLPRDLYITDSGGRLRSRLKTFGRGRVRRADMDAPPPYAHIVGILTHPIWWNLEDPRPEDVEFPTFAQLSEKWPPKEQRNAGT